MEYSHNIFVLYDGNNGDEIISGFEDKNCMLEYVRTKILEHIKPELIQTDDVHKLIIIQRNSKLKSESTRYKFDTINYHVNRKVS